MAPDTPQPSAGAGFPGARLWGTFRPPPGLRDMRSASLVLSRMTSISTIAIVANAGTLAAFVAVCAAMLVLRRREPNTERKFRAPAAWVVAPDRFAAAEWYRERVAMFERGDTRLRDTLEKDTADVYSQSPSELEAGLLIRRQSTADPRGYGNACAAMAGLNAAPLDPELGRIGVPALIVASELDRHCPPKAAEIIASGIKGSQIEVIAGAGHPIPVERPDELARMINSFLSHLD